MTYDPDKPVDERRFERESATFKHAYLTVQGVDEDACDKALRAQLETFTDDPDKWIVGSSNYVRRELATGVDGEAKIVVWELEATLACHTGYVPWSGLE